MPQAPSPATLCCVDANICGGPTSCEQKANEKRRICEMNEQAKEHKTPNNDDPERELQIKSHKVAASPVAARSMDERAKDRAAKEGADNVDSAARKATTHASAETKKQAATLQQQHAASALASLVSQPSIASSTLSKGGAKGHVRRLHPCHLHVVRLLLGAREGGGGAHGLRASQSTRPRRAVPHSQKGWQQHCARPLLLSVFGTDCHVSCLKWLLCLHVGCPTRR